MKEIREFFKGMIESGEVKGHIEGPRDNVLVCDAMADWCVASGEMVRAGYEVNSPGGFGGSAPLSRANTWNKIWRNGELCAIVVEQRKVLVFTLPRDIHDVCHVVENNVDKINT